MAFLLFGFISACDDSASDSASSERLYISLLADGVPAEELTFNAGAESVFTLTVTAASGSPVENATLIFAEEGGFISIDGGVSSSNGKFNAAVIPEIYSLNARYGSVMVTAVNGKSVGTLLIPYTIAAWDGVLFGGGLTVNASAMPNTTERVKEFEPPQGLAFESISPAISDGVRFEIIGGKLRVTAPYMAADGIRTVSVKVTGADKFSKLDINVRTGIGTALNPYPIGTAEEFILISEHTASPTYFILDNDIDLTDTTLPGMRSFSGGLDGDNHSIFNLRQTLFGPKGKVSGPAPAQNDFPDVEVKNLNITLGNGGIFSSPDGVGYSNLNGVIVYVAKNLTAENIHIFGDFAVESGSGSINAGFLAGRIYGTLKISDLTIDGILTVNAASRNTQLNFGFLAGASAYGNIVDVSVRGVINVSSPEPDSSQNIYLYGGGLLGYIGTGASIYSTISDMSIKNAAVNADINAETAGGRFYVGGLIGAMNGAGNTIESCYFNGNINIGEPAGNPMGADGIGGIIGRVAATVSEPNIIKNSYSAGSVIVQGDSPKQYSYVGGIIGYKNSADAIVNLSTTYSIAAISSPGTSGGIVGGKLGSEITAVNNIALNPSVRGVYARVRVGKALSGAGYAHGALRLLSDGKTVEIPEEGSLEDGITVSAEALTTAFFIRIGFNRDVWDTDFLSRDYKFPILKGVDGKQENLSMPNY
jgi:hypothetical protein